MDIKTWIGTAGTIASSATAALTLAGYVSSSYIKYLDVHFATKQDLAAVADSLHRIEEKINGWTDDSVSSDVEAEPQLENAEARQHQHGRSRTARTHRDSPGQANR